MNNDSEIRNSKWRTVSEAYDVWQAAEDALLKAEDALNLARNALQEAITAVADADDVAAEAYRKWIGLRNREYSWFRIREEG